LSSSLILQSIYPGGQEEEIKPRILCDLEKEKYVDFKNDMMQARYLVVFIVARHAVIIIICLQK
jgi:hypothetical protein